MNFSETHAARGLPATLTVEDLTDGERGYARGPERALMAALLFDGVQSYIHYALAKTQKAKSKYAEAHRWIFEMKGEYVFSFDKVCEALGVNPEYFRYGLLNAGTSLLAQMEKSRRNF